jgi:hypothetical protein
MKHCYVNSGSAGGQEGFEPHSRSISDAPQGAHLKAYLWIGVQKQAWLSFVPIL